MELGTMAVKKGRSKKSAGKQRHQDDTQQAVILSSTPRSSRTPTLLTILLGVLLSAQQIWKYLYGWRNNKDLTHCHYYMAPSTIPNGGWGIFTSQSIAQHQPVLYDDLIVSLLDVKVSQEAGIYRLLHNYSWYGTATGSSHEAKSVVSLWPGLSTLSNAHPNDFNVVPESSKYHPPSSAFHPNFGARTYYSAQYFAYHDLPAGSELFVNYGHDYALPKARVKGLKRSVDELNNQGICLDGVRPGPSRILRGGNERGVLATRSFAINDIVIATSLLPFLRSSLESTPNQLFLNYCYGHVHSPILFFFYAPTINYINHDRHTANVKTQWSKHSIDPNSFSLDDLKQRQPTGLVVDFVATRHILPGEEIVLDYGDVWSAAWEAHVKEYTPPDYSSSMEYNTKHSTIDLPSIPDNLQSHCYIPDNFLNLSQWPDGQRVHKHPSFLRPCGIVDRNSRSNTYTVTVQGHKMVNVPRSALWFLDRPYTSPQHYPGSFRHEIQLSIFPEHWKE